MEKHSSYQIAPNTHLHKTPSLLSNLDHSSSTVYLQNHYNPSISPIRQSKSNVKLYPISKVSIITHIEHKSRASLSSFSPSKIRHLGRIKNLYKRSAQKLNNSLICSGQLFEISKKSYVSPARSLNRGNIKLLPLRSSVTPEPIEKSS
jgi:hypothetical protein